MRLKVLVLVMVLGFSLKLGAQNYTVLDNMDSDTGWGTFADDKGSSSSISTVTGKEGKALSMEFDLGTGFWAVIGKDINKDLTGLKRIRFYYRYKGNPNTLEVKLIDEDGSNFLFKKEIKETLGWEQMEINFSQFSYGWGGDAKLNLKNIKRIEVAISKGTGGSGELVIDKIEYEGLTRRAAAEATGIRAGRLVIDDFERLDPLSMYIPLKNDDSDLKLTTTRQYIIEGNYSMELDYELNTTKPYPSSVSAHWSGEEPLDWSGVEIIKIWVKGDGSANYFRINIIDGSGEVWSYEDREVLLHKNWKLISIPIEKFKIPAWAKRNNGVFDRDEIKGYEISIAGRTPKFSAGKIYVDNFYVIGKDLIPAIVVPKEVMIPIALKRPQGNFDIRGFALVEYKNVPTQGNILGSYGRLIFEAKLKKFGFYTEITIGYKEFADAAAINNEGYLEERKPALESTSTFLYLNDLLPYLYYIRIGNLWIDFSDYTFSPFHTKLGEWGYKGIYGEGRIGKFSLQLFMLAHHYNSYTWGIRTDRTFKGIFTRAIFVKYTGRAKVESTGQIIDGVIDKSKTGDLKTERVEEDTVFTINFDKYILGFLRIRGIYGENHRIRYADAYYSDPFNPIYNYRIYPPEKKIGHLIKTEIEILDVPFMDSSMYFNIRDVDNNFKPKYRKKPEDFDELTSNQTGFNIRLSQGYRGWVLAVEYDYFKRKDDNSKYRSWFMWGIDRYNWHNFDFFFHQEFKRQDDAFERWLETDKVYKNEKVIAYVFRTTYRFSPKANIIDEVRFEDIYHPETDKRYSSGKLYFRLEYYIFGNNKIYIEYQFLRTGDPNWRSTTDDNYFKAVMEMSF